MTKVLIATDKPFAPVAVKGIREIVEAQGYELALLEKYTSPEELIAAVADVDAMIIRSDKATKEVIDAIVRNHAVYFAAIGGAGALLSKCITKSEVICYDDLGAEAIRKIEIKDFPVIVVIDSQGNNLYETAIKEFASL